MGWDSNPRGALTPAGFQDRCLKPLGHPSLVSLSFLTKTKIERFSLCSVVPKIASSKRIPNERPRATASERQRARTANDGFLPHPHEAGGTRVTAATVVGFPRTLRLSGKCRIIYKHLVFPRRLGARSGPFRMPGETAPASGRPVGVLG